jgi:hypothetical protein
MFQKIREFLKYAKEALEGYEVIVRITTAALPIAALVWMYLKGQTPIVIAAAVLGTLVFGLIVVTLLVLAWRRIGATIAGARIAVNIGQDGHYVASSNHVYNVMKTVRVGVKNVGDKFLSNCMVHFETHQPDTGKVEKWAAEHSVFSLNQGEERYISLASHSEAIPPHPQGVQTIRLAAPPSGTYWRAPDLPASGGAVTITATSAESPSSEVVCKLWVENDKLRWERA